jgi:outer membrane protein OmpA-like peptidoglycan-associated protein
MIASDHPISWSEFMSRSWSRAAGAATVCLAMLALGCAVFAQQPSAGDIANSLAPKTTLTRGLSAPNPRVPQDRRFLDGLKSKNTRSITVEERNQVADIAKDKPGVDLEVNFDYDSVTIGPQAIDTLTKLGVALRDPRLKDALVLVAGHTDAKGNDAYNKDLSDRRADAVKQFLVAKFSLPASNLIALGYGKERLKNTADPFASENRRVQVVNLSAQ